jgi:hypothetical protein
LIARIGCVAGIIVSTLIRLMKFGSEGICPRMQLRRSTEIFVHKQTDFFSSLLVVIQIRKLVVRVSARFDRHTN